MGRAFTKSPETLQNILPYGPRWSQLTGPCFWEQSVLRWTIGTADTGTGLSKCGVNLWMIGTWPMLLDQQRLLTLMNDTSQEVGQASVCLCSLVRGAFCLLEPCLASLPGDTGFPTPAAASPLTVREACGLQVQSLLA